MTVRVMKNEMVENVEKIEGVGTCREM